MTSWGGTSGYRRLATTTMDRPPQSIDDAPIGLDEASALIADLGFLLFRTPGDGAIPDSCLMTTIHGMPTERHFDPELI